MAGIDSRAKKGDLPVRLSPAFFIGLGFLVLGGLTATAPGEVHLPMGVGFFRGFRLGILSAGPDGPNLAREACLGLPGSGFFRRGSLKPVPSRQFAVRSHVFIDLLTVDRRTPTDLTMAF